MYRVECSEHTHGRHEPWLFRSGLGDKRFPIVFMGGDCGGVEFSVARRIPSWTVVRVVIRDTEHREIRINGVRAVSVDMMQFQSKPNALQTQHMWAFCVSNR